MTAGIKATIRPAATSGGPASVAGREGAMRATRTTKTSSRSTSPPLASHSPRWPQTPLRDERFIGIDLLCENEERTRSTDGLCALIILQTSRNAHQVLPPLKWQPPGN